MAGPRPRAYDYIRYNRYGVLRPGPELWLALLFQCRHVIGIGLIAMAGGGRRGGMAATGDIDLSSLGHLLNPLFTLADIPALALLLALAARLPGAGDLPRWLWRRGRLLLLASAAIYGGLYLYHLPARPAAIPLGDWLGLAGTAAVAAYAVLSVYLRDLFGEFPERPAEPPKPA